MLCYFYFIVINNFFILFHRTSICTGVINVEVTFIRLFIEVQMLWPHCDVMFILLLYFLDLPMHRDYSAEAVIYLF